MLFEDMGIKYVGPIDGHDINVMNEVFKKVKQIRRACNNTYNNSKR